MAPIKFVQELPPAGGFRPSPGIPSSGVRKVSPVRGPHGIISFGIVFAVVGYGIYQHLGNVEERNYYNLAKFNERFERLYVLQAQDNAMWWRKHKEALDQERELMKDVPGWIVNKRRYFTVPNPPPVGDTFDGRKPASW